MKTKFTKLIAFIAILTLIPIQGFASLITPVKGGDFALSTQIANTTDKREGIEAEIIGGSSQNRAIGLLFEKRVAPPARSVFKRIAEISTASPDILEVNTLQTNMERTDAAAIAFYKTPANLGMTTAEYNEISAQALAVVAEKTTDLEKARAIYKWVTEYLYYDYWTFYNSASTNNSAASVFKKKRAVCEGYAELTNVMLRAVGIPSKVIIGFSKSPGLLTSTDVSVNSGTANHTWNEAYFDAGDGAGAKWQTLDTTWGSGNTYFKDYSLDNVDGPMSYDYFMPSADFFARSHLTKTTEFNYIRAINDGVPVTVPAIYSNASLTGGTLAIPEGTKYIYANSFKGLTGLNSITLPSSVEGIAYGAFENCTNLKSVNFGSVVYISENALKSTGLTSLILPKTTKYIIAGAFRGLTSLTSIFCDSGNENLKVDNNVLYNSNMSELLLYANASSATTYNIPNTVIAIPDSCFLRNLNLKTVVIGSGVKTINHDAFMYAKALETIDIPDNVTTMGLNIFLGANKLKTANIGKSVLEISWCVFIGCDSLETITVNPLSKRMKSMDGVLYTKSLESATFNELVHFPAANPAKTITLPSTLNLIGYRALDGANELRLDDKSVMQTEKFAIEPGNTAYSVENGIWYNANKTELIMIPQNLQVKQLELPYTSKTPNITSALYSGLKNVVSISFAAGFQSISKYAFSGCSALKSVVLPDGFKTIAAESFNANRLGFVYVPSTVTSIGNSSFQAGVILVGDKESAAETYASNNGLTFVSTLPFIKDIQPSVSVTVGETAELNYYYFDKTPVTIKWYKNTDKTKVGATQVAGASGFSYKIDCTVADTKYYYAEATDGSGKLLSTSSFCKLDINKTEEYGIYYKLDGGTLPGNAENTYMEGSSYTLPIPSKTGFIFDGWYLSTSSNSAVTEIKTTNTGDLTFYARWKSNSNIIYHITYKLNGGILIDPITLYETGKSVTLPKPVRSNYTFGGWFDNASFSGTAVTNINVTDTGDKTFYAKWNGGSFSIIYISNSGTMPSGTKYTYTNGTSYKLPTPVRTGYVFKGWFLDASFTGTIVLEISSADSENKRFYAKWEASGSGTPTASPTPTSTPSTTPTPTPGTTPTPTSTPTPTTTQTPKPTVTPKPTATPDPFSEISIPCVVVFMDGNKVLRTEIILTGKKISTKKPTKSGYTFVAWYKDSKFKSVFKISTPVTKTMKLYAKFKKK